MKKTLVLPKLFLKNLGVMDRQNFYAREATGKVNAATHVTCSLLFPPAPSKCTASQYQQP